MWLVAPYGQYKLVILELRRTVTNNGHINRGGSSVILSRTHVSYVYCANFYMIEYLNHRRRIVTNLEHQELGTKSLKNSYDFL
jgi:hypothetical protein